MSTASSTYDRSEVFKPSKQFDTAGGIRGRSSTTPIHNVIAEFRGLSLAVHTTASTFFNAIAGEKWSVASTNASTAFRTGTVHISSLDIATIEDTKSELLSYINLRNGWDGEGSLAPSKRKISDAFSFLEALPPIHHSPLPTVFNDGEVGLYWEKGENVLSIIFFGDGKQAYYGKVNGIEYRSNIRQTFTAVDQQLLHAILSI